MRINGVDSKINISIIVNLYYYQLAVFFLISQLSNVSFGCPIVTEA